MKKYFCLFIGVFFLLITFITHTSLFSFGFISGAGLVGYMLLNDEKRGE